MKTSSRARPISPSSVVEQLPGRARRTAGPARPRRGPAPRRRTSGPRRRCPAPKTTCVRVCASCGQRTQDARLRRKTSFSASRRSCGARWAHIAGRCYPRRTGATVHDEAATFGGGPHHDARQEPRLSTTDSTGIPAAEPERDASHDRHRRLRPTGHRPRGRPARRPATRWSARSVAAPTPRTPTSSCCASRTPRSARPPRRSRRARCVGHCSGATGARRPRRPRGGLALHPLMTVTAAGRRASPARAARSPARRRRRWSTRARARRPTCGMRPFEIADDDRAAYHAAASVASNFLVTLEGAAERLAGDGRRAALGARPARPRDRRQLGRRTAPSGADRPDRPRRRGDRRAPARRRRRAHARDLLALFDALADATRALAGRARAGAGMRTVRTVAELRAALAPERRAGARASASSRRWAPCTTATCR